MAQTKIGINGFGRIGRSAFKVAFDRSDLAIALINDVADIQTLAYLLRHDSAYGAYKYAVTVDGDDLIVNDTRIRVTHEAEPQHIAWQSREVELVIETTGAFVSREAAEKHIEAGAKKVIIGGLSSSNDVDTIVFGANEDRIESAGSVVSAGGHATNSLGAVLAVLDAEFGVQKSIVTTIQGYTSRQSLQDSPTQGMRESRGAAQNIVPVNTEESRATVKTLPHLQDKIDELSIRVPAASVSIGDITVLLERSTTREEINAAFTRAASEPYYQGILGVSDEPLVSSDYVGNSFSGVVDLLLTQVVDGTLARIMVWNDNEWGYASRLVELAADVAKSLRQ